MALGLQGLLSPPNAELMKISTNQRGLFPNKPIARGKSKDNGIPLSRDLLVDWQRRVNDHQSTLFKGETNKFKQGSLFQSNQLIPANFNPLDITPLPLSFWRWPTSPHQGPAIYLVMDRPKKLNTPILLYIGEDHGIIPDTRGKVFVD